MTTALEVEELMPQLDDDGGPTHLLCCEDDCLAYCGKRLRSAEFEPQDSPVTCAPCIEADEKSICPKTGIMCRWT